MKHKEAINIIGGLSKPSKMPCHGYSIPASRCITGSKLAKVEGSVCSQCYAFRANYGYKNVQNCLEKRYQSLSNPLWIDAMVLAIIVNEQSGYFRWHDSGDLQGVWHLSMIAEVCRRTPHIKHWLPTREYKILSQFIDDGNKIPDNLVIRLSGLMTDGPTPDALAKRLGICVSGVARNNFTCPSHYQNNKCGSCRACWSRNTFSVTYKKH